MLTRSLIALAVLLSVTLSPAYGGDRETLAAVNAIRTSHGLKPLQLHPRLQKAARHQSSLMAKTGRMAHTVSRGQDFSSRLKRVGWRGRTAAENIAYGQPSLRSVLRGWMGSFGHRRNMLNPRMRYLGLAVAKRGQRKYWTMMLGG